MLQLETLMLFGLGFAVAALIALFVARALWLYALRLGRLRSLRQAPATHADLRTEINRLKAENAMTAVRLERKAEALSARNAELIARTTRDNDRLDLLAAELERHRHRRPDREAQDRAQAEIAALETEARQTIDALEMEIAERERLIAELRRSVAAREEEIEGLRVSADRFAEDIAARDQRLAELEQGFEPSAQPASRREPAPGKDRFARAAAFPAAPANERLRMRIDELADLSREIEEQRQPLKAAHDPLDTAGAADSVTVSAVAEEPPHPDAAAAPPQPARGGRRAVRPATRAAGIEALASRLKTIRRDGPPS